MSVPTLEHPQPATATRATPGSAAPPRPARPRGRRRRVVILSQVYVPDPAAVGQQLHNFAAKMAARGHEVIVYCASRGYDDPSVRYPLNETIDGVTVRRYWLPLFNKTVPLLRVLGSLWAMLALLFAAIFTARVDLIFFSTSPPLIGYVATAVAMMKRVPRVYWAMDLNPDQLVAMGKLRVGSPLWRVLESANQFIIRHATLTVALDRFMADRLRSAGRRPADLIVLPPWPHEDVLEQVPHASNGFRHRHGLDDKFVVMYSGNHTPANPLDTLLKAALSLRDDPDIRFAFVGGGMAKKQVNDFLQTHQLANCLSLPYQPLAELHVSLSAADVHVVSLGDDMVGIIHPCKVYGAMAVGRPVLFLGPKPSHVSDLLDKYAIGWHVAHGDVDGCVRVLREIRSASRETLARMGDRAQRALVGQLSQDVICGRLCDAVTELLPASGRRR
jgi:glycosyltransferase involved in cell wall biosynthesis